MSLCEDSKFFNENLYIKIDKLILPEICNELIKKYEQFSFDNSIEVTSKKITDECSNIISTKKINTILSKYFKLDYKIFWSSFDVVKSNALENNPSTLWHLDGGSVKTLKLFIYLNPVSIHGGNTLIVDQNRTKVLRDVGALPIEQEKRKLDLSSTLQELKLDTSTLSYDYEAGSALLFSPLLLAHRCLPPKNNQKRYTICFTIVSIRKL